MTHAWSRGLTLFKGSFSFCWFRFNVGLAEQSIIYAFKLKLVLSRDHSMHRLSHHFFCFCEIMTFSFSSYLPFHLTTKQRCIPMSLVLDMQGTYNNFGTFPEPNRNQNVPCPVCCRGTVSGIYIEPLDFTDIERSIELKKNGCDESSSSSVNSSSSSSQQQQKAGKKHARDEDPEIEAESTYLLLSNNHSSFSNSSLSREQQRTGRWTNEEIAFVDYLVSAFDQGALPLPHGIKLNEFLGDMLLCKSSRLTKKMKNAKLSTRSFVVGSSRILPSRNDREVLSGLQDRFLSSIPSEATRLELKFNLAKQWRTHFSNLCLQVEYPYLEAKDWFASLEEMEARATRAEDAVRRVRRRRMGMALQTDGGNSANPSVFIGGVKADTAASQPNFADIVTSAPTTDKVRTISASGEETESKDYDDSFGFLNGSGGSLSPDANNNGTRSRSRTLSVDLFANSRLRSFSDDFDAVLDTLMDDEPPAAAPIENTSSGNNSGKEGPSSHSCSPFLDAIVMYMETHNLPFQHADLWVPSYTPEEGREDSFKGEGGERVRLFHAGHASRGDLDGGLAYKLHEFGVYSDHFSFEPGHGLPGRVYTSGEISWECGIQQKDPKIFERVGGAKVYGVKTAVGIPLNTALVGRIVVAMYSCDNVPENMAVARDCAAELAKYSPEPKWKLCIDMDSSLRGLPKVHTPMHQGISGPIENADSFTLSPINSKDTTADWDSAGTSCDYRSLGGADTEELQLVSLLGEHMPTGNDASVQLFMSTRLLLLRPADKRTRQENEMIDILKNSFRSYSKDSRRDGKELARLLVKDWECLQSTYAFPAKALPLAPPSMNSSFPKPHRSFSDTDRMMQRRTSSGSLPPPSFMPMSTPPSAQSVKSTISAPASMNPSYQPFSLGSPQMMAPPSQQLTHTRYMPQPPTLSLKQFSNDNRNQSGTSLGSSNSQSPGFQPQSIPSTSSEYNPMNPISPH